MGSFGDRLKKEREQRGISLDDISLTTKIGTRLLRALEEEKFDQLPGGIFNKGFVRAYARHVGLDEDQTVADYMTAVGANQPKPEEEAFPVPVAQRGTAPAAPSPRIHVVGKDRRREPAAEIPWGVLAIVLLVVALAFASWSYFHRTPQVERNRIAPASTAETAPPSGSAPDNGAPGPTPPPNKNEPVPDKRGTAPATPIPTTEQIGTRPSPVAQAGLQTAMPTQTPGTFTVRLKGNDDSEECWVSIVVDGQPPVEVTLVAPYEKVVQARNEVVVKAGNVGALDVFMNGKKLPSQGEYGTVKTLVFRPDGLQAPALKPLAAVH